ncbi:MAG TPA: N-acetylmannosamine-6-phosphate 2-epimerase [Terriglobia bacterium]|nr:N-acetylmannosamine-6-phosphate 2-epimerase [Terriglobia bacterium]
MVVLNKKSTLLRLKHGLIISCQPRIKSALDHPRFVAALATVAEQQGAAGVRIRGVRDIRAVAGAVDIPTIGLEKITDPDSDVYITPTIESVRRVSRAGAQIIAMDATERPRPKGQHLANIVNAAKDNLDALLMADIATLKEGVEAAKLGFDMVGTTLCGYTENTRHRAGPAFELARRLVREIDIPVILEGRVQKPDHVRKAFELGVYAVVAGTAVTDFEWLARRFIDACPNAKAGSAEEQRSRRESRRADDLKSGRWKLRP